MNAGVALEHRREGKWTRPREETGGAGGRGRARRRQGWEERGGVKTEEEEGIRPRRGAVSYTHLTLPTTCGV